MNVKEQPIYVHGVARARSFAEEHHDRDVISNQDVAPWTAKRERSGNPVLPDEVFAVLVEECEKHPGPAADETFGLVLNATAWRTRHLGMGLSRKTGGKHVDSPVGPIAEDIICHSGGHHWDVLGGAATGAPLRPGRGPSIGIIDLRARPWVAPVDPGGATDPQPVPVPPTPQPVPPTPTPQPTPGVDLGPVLAELRAQREQVSALSARVEDLIGKSLIDTHVLDILGRLDRNHAAIGAKSGGGEVCVLRRRGLADADPKALADAVRGLAAKPKKARTSPAK